MPSLDYHSNNAPRKPSPPPSPPTKPLPSPPPYTRSAGSPTIKQEYNAAHVSVDASCLVKQLQPYTIVIDPSTRVIGHCNTLQLPQPTLESPSKIAAAVAMALKKLENEMPEGNTYRRVINVKVQTGVSICGSKNIVVFQRSATSCAGMRKPKGTTDRDLKTGTKRKADALDGTKATPPRKSRKTVGAY
ncbi:hypothetical protein MMC09_003450 [Bachmanniomyces sp. S44760]|nr:hypothetical protein [Bachmanniomyces sp. S44760]